MRCAACRRGPLGPFLRSAQWRSLHLTCCLPDCRCRQCDGRRCRRRWRERCAQEREIRQRRGLIRRPSLSPARELSLGGRPHDQPWLISHACRSFACALGSLHQHGETRPPNAKIRSGRLPGFRREAQTWGATRRVRTGPRPGTHTSRIAPPPYTRLAALVAGGQRQPYGSGQRPSGQRWRGQQRTCARRSSGVMAVVVAWAQCATGRTCDGLAAVADASALDTARAAAGAAAKHP